MIPPHSTPTLQVDGSIIRPQCWCECVTIFVRAVNDLGEEYVYPHTYHEHPVWLFHALAEGPGRIPPI